MSTHQSRMRQQGATAIESALLVAFVVLLLGGIAPRFSAVVAPRLAELGGGTSTSNPGGACEIDEETHTCAPVPGDD